MDVYVGGVEGFVSRRGVEDGECECGVCFVCGYGFVVFVIVVDWDGGDFGFWVGFELYVFGVLFVRGVVF